MDFMKIITKQLIEIIEWTDDSRDTLSYRWPDEDKEIKNGAQLIVRESQQVQFVSEGQFADLFNPGRYLLTTQNIPVLSTLRGWKYGFNSPFKCDVYYINTRLFTGNKWGTSNPIMMRDKDFGVIRLRAFGTYDFRITNAALFLKEVAGTDQNFRIDEFADTMRSRIVSIFSEALRRPRCRHSMWPSATASWATRCFSSSTRPSARNTAWKSPASCWRTFPCRPRWSRPSTSAPAWAPSATSTTM